MRARRPLSARSKLLASAALLGLLLAAPLYGIISRLIQRESPGPVLFRQARPGRHGEIFHLIKFRSMRDAFDAQGNPLPDAERITRIGSFLRRTSLDELPSFWNVLKGEMSLVGPRPLLVRYLDRYTPEQARRHEVKPGITGWAQIHGLRGGISTVKAIQRRVDFDNEYITHRNLRLNILILVRTIREVLRQTNAY